MEEETKDAPEVLETQEVESETTEENKEAETETLSKEEIAELREKASKAEEFEKKNKQLFERAKKAESSSKKQDGLSERDVLYLARATDIAPEDVDEVVNYAHKMGVSVSEAHKFYKPILAERTEERKTAQTTQTKGSRVASKTSGEDLLQKAEKGEILKDTDLDAIAAARMARRVAEKQQ